MTGLNIWNDVDSHFPCIEQAFSSFVVNLPRSLSHSFKNISLLYWVHKKLPEYSPEYILLSLYIIVSEPENVFLSWLGLVSLEFKGRKTQVLATISRIFIDTHPYLYNVRPFWNSTSICLPWLVLCVAWTVQKNSVVLSSFLFHFYSRCTLLTYHHSRYDYNV